MVVKLRNPPNLPIDHDRPIKVVCIGAGYSGILTAIRFPQKIKNLQLTIYEKNQDIGGTWYENKYPGIACDIPSHVYQLSFAPNPNWSRFYAPGGEIQEYLKDLAHKYDVEKYVRFQHMFQSAAWDVETQKWFIKLKDLQTDRVFTDTADVLLKGTGILNSWTWPDIPGLKNFKGKLLHSAAWDENYDLSGKRLAVIGGGSSGIQIMATVQSKAKHIYHYMKGKTWISPFGYGAEDSAGDSAGGEVIHSTEERERWTKDPAEYLRYRHKIEGGMNKAQTITFRGAPIVDAFWEMSKTSMETKLAKKPHIYEALKPSYPPGCRRLTPGPGYLEALVEENVEFISSGIENVTETGIKDKDGNLFEVDAIICATGFDTSLNQDATPITGIGGVTLGQVWDPIPEAYLSLCSPKMPNLFFYLGPNGGPGAGSFIYLLECVCEYIIKCVKKLQREYIASMTVTSKANAAFSAHVDEYFAKTIFTYNCKSWFKRNIPDGRVVALWPGSSIHAAKCLESPRFEDFEYVTLPEMHSNPLNWLGNGMTVAQEEDTMTTEYLNHPDVPPIINKSPRNTTKISLNGTAFSKNEETNVEMEVVSAVSALPS